MNPREIIELAHDIREEFKTRNPFTIAEGCGVSVFVSNVLPKSFKAQIIKTQNYPPFISINGKYSNLSQEVLCAHELGHALLHEDGINFFDTTKANMMTNVEYEANLFAVALLFDETDFCLPLTKMNGTLLQLILDSNIQ